MAVKNCFIRGSVVRYVTLPAEHVDTQLLEDATRRGTRLLPLYDRELLTLSLHISEAANQVKRWWYQGSLHLYIKGNEKKFVTTTLSSSIQPQSGRLHTLVIVVNTDAIENAVGNRKCWTHICNGEFPARSCLATRYLMLFVRTCKIVFDLVALGTGSFRGYSPSLMKTGLYYHTRWKSIGLSLE